jgi:hypothetical protein
MGSSQLKLHFLSNESLITSNSLLRDVFFSLRTKALFNKQFLFHLRNNPSSNPSLGLSILYCIRKQLCDGGKRMLTGIQIALIGGDARQLEVIRKFSELDASVQLIGFDNLQYAFHGITKSMLNVEVLHTMDAIILPPVGTDERGNVESIFSTKELILTGDHIAALPKHAKVYTGMAKGYLKTLCSDHAIEQKAP